MTISIAPPEVYARHLESGLTTYSRDEAITALADAMTAEQDYRVACLEAAPYLPEWTEPAFFEPATGIRSALANYFETHNAPAYPSHGKANEIYPVRKWQSAARSFRHQAKKIRAIIAATLEPANYAEAQAAEGDRIEALAELSGA